MVVAPPSTLYRFQVDLSDIDRGVYEILDFRAAMHPSESLLYLVTRVLAFVLNSGESVAFSPEGLSDPDAPCIRSLDTNGTTLIWIEIGNPSARKLHKAAKGAKQVKVYTYKDPVLLLKELAGAQVHRAEDLEIYSLSPKFLESLAATLERNNSWTVIHHEQALTVTMGEKSFQAELFRHILT